MSNRKNSWQKVGEIGVDAGLCWIGDPCYIIGTQTRWESWSDFCEELHAKFSDSDNTVSFPYDLGHEGLGVVVSTGYGDGVYPVEVRRKGAEGRVMEVRVRFD